MFHSQTFQLWVPHLYQDFSGPSTGSLALYQEGHFDSVGERKQVRVSSRALLSAQPGKSVEQGRSYCCSNLSCLPRTGSVGFLKWMIQMYLSIYICLEKIDISGCNSICSFPNTPALLFPCFVTCSVTWNQVALDTLNTCKQVIMSSKVNHLPKVRKENWVVTSFTTASDLGFSSVFPHQFLSTTSICWVWNSSLYVLSTNNVSLQGLIMELLEIGILDGKLDSSFWIFFFRLCQLELPAYLTPIHSVSDKSHLNICSEVFFSEFSWMNSWVNSNRINFCERTVMFHNIF